MNLRNELFLVLAQSLQRYHSSMDPVPTSFSRHATAHSISPALYTEVNSLASLLVVVALIAETDELMVWADRNRMEVVWRTRD